MKFRGLHLLLSLLFAGCSEDTPPAGLKLTLQRWEAANECWSTLPNQEFDPSSIGLASCQDASSPMGPILPDAGRALAGGSDQLRLVVSYGDVPFSPGTAPPAPTVTMLVDGVVTPTGAGIASSPGNSPAYFLATCTAPARAVSQLVLSAQAATGFAGTTRAFEVAAPTVVVDVAQCAQDDCTIASGVGAVSVTLSVPGQTPTDVTLTSLVDGVPELSPRTVRLQTQAADANGQLIMQARTSVDVPVAAKGKQWVLVANWSTGGGSSYTMTLVPPDVTVSVQGCPTGCNKTSGLGSVMVDVQVPGSSPVDVPLTWTVDDILQSGSLTVRADSLTTDASGASTMTGSTSITVPSATGNAEWRIQGELGGATFPAALITIDAATPTVKIPACPEDEQCRKTAGIGFLGLDVEVPANSAQDVTLTWAINGIPQAGSLPARLTTVVSATGPVRGSVSVPVPVARRESIWEITVHSGANRAPAPPVILSTPELSVITPDCPAEGQCSVTGGVGTFALELEIPAGTQQTAAITWSIDGVPQHVEQTARLDELLSPIEGPAAGRAFVPVPSAPDGALWNIVIRSGASTATVENIRVHRPTIDLEFTCGSRCSAKAGATLGIQVAVPTLSQTTSAALSTFIDRTPDVRDATLNLTRRNASNDTIFGLTSLPVPNRPGSRWEVRANVGAYDATPLEIDIVP